MESRVWSRPRRARRLSPKDGPGNAVGTRGRNRPVIGWPSALGKAIGRQWNRDFGGFMRAVLQRVSKASVTIDAQIVGAIDRGWLVLLGVGAGDGPDEAAQLADKTLNLRAFPDNEGKMNRS